MAKFPFELLTLENEVFTAYLFWSAILVLKMLIMGPLTGYYRVKTQTFVNPEDVISKKLKVKFDDPDVERVRRAHRNDLENILPFLAIGFLYVLINPSNGLAINLFRAVGISRIVHTIVYAIVVVPQPSRALAFFVALLATAYMAFQTFVNPEDFVDKRIKLKFDHPEVERLRRVHRNDLENILPFFVVGILYVLSDPSPVVAINMFRAVAISRLAHTYIYIYAKPQPARFIAYLSAVVPMIYISLMVIYSSF